VHEVCRTADLEIGLGYAKQVYGAGSDRSSGRNGFGLSERPVSITDLVDRRDVISQQSVRQAVRRSAFDARAVLRKEWAAGSKLWRSRC
jgi:hypothetical protein